MSPDIVGIIGLKIHLNIETNIENVNCNIIIVYSYKLHLQKWYIASGKADQNSAYQI